MSYKNRAKEYIYNEFVRFGLETEYHTFDEPRLSSTVSTFYKPLSIVYLDTYLNAFLLSIQAYFLNTPVK
jgi:hypothetical protein